MRIYISSGDTNGIGLELILRNHEVISNWCEPIYCVHKNMLKEASNILNLPMPSTLNLSPPSIDSISLQAGIISAKSGEYSFASFNNALNLALQNNAPLLTLPIHKYAWNLAGIKHAGHTEYLRHRFGDNAIMMLGCEEMFVALYTDHIPLREVSDRIDSNLVANFLWNLYSNLSLMQLVGHDEKEQTHIEIAKNLQHIAIKESALKPQMVSRLLERRVILQDSIKPVSRKRKSKQILVLGVNPHAGDNGVLGHEDTYIKEAIEALNERLGEEIFIGPVSPDSAFIPANRERYRIFVAMYHDSGLAPLKALYFDRSINVSLNIPLLRVSPDHGVGFDIAYKIGSNLNSKSYLECFRFLLG